jgi:precorrin-2 dehydrogenase/sirohydrochlorin ferrochelatase
MIPLIHDFTGRTVLVFGGGTVGARKAERFAREAHVVVVSPTFVDEFGAADRRETTHESWQPSSSKPGIELVRDAPAPEDVVGWIDRVEPALVVAATDSEAVNEAAATAARARDVLINRTDRAGGRDAGSVVVPATVDDGSVTVAITTGGASPALSKYLREQVEEDIEGAGAMAELTSEIRAELKHRELPPAERRDAVRRVVRSPRVWKALRTGTTNARSVAEDVMRTDTTTPDREGPDP